MGVGDFTLVTCTSQPQRLNGALRWRCSRRILRPSVSAFRLAPLMAGISLLEGTWGSVRMRDRVNWAYMFKAYIYMVQRRPPPPPPPVDGSWSPPPLWLWGCGGALLVSDAADFLWFLVPPPPPLWMCGWVMVVVAVLEVCI